MVTPTTAIIGTITPSPSLTSDCELAPARLHAAATRPAAVLSCSVLVTSCDRDRDLWPPFFELFWRYWPNCPFPVYLGANCKRFEDARIAMLHAGPERADLGDESWSKRLKFFLNRLDSEYVLLLTENFFLDGRVSNQTVSRNLDALHKLRGSMMRLQPIPGANSNRCKHTDISAIHRLARFRVSTQPAIWRRSELLALLRDGESASEFVKMGAIRSRANPDGYFCACEPGFEYRQVLDQDEWFWSAVKRYRKEGIVCDFKTRPIIGPIREAGKTVYNFATRAAARLLEAPLRWGALQIPGLDDEFPKIRNSATIGSNRARPPRVAVLTNIIPPYHKPVLDCLARRYGGIRVLLSTPMEKNRPWKLEWDGLDVVMQKTITLKGNWRHPRGFSEPLSLHFPLDTVQQLQRYGADVVISNEMGTRTLLAAIYRKLRRDTRLIVWVEETQWTKQGRGLARHLLRRFLYKHVDAFLAVGSSGMRYIQSLGVERKRIYKITYTTDVCRFASSDLKRPPQAAKQLLYVGQMIERKGLVHFLQVLARWAEANPGRSVAFRLVGDGPLRGALEHWPTPSNLKLQFIGTLQYDQLPDVYKEAGVFVLPTFADTWGVVVNEALAAGVPVLGSIYGQAVEELIREGENGWTFRTDRPEEIYSALDRMMNTPAEELDRMRSCARFDALALTPDYTAGLIDAAIQSCVRN